MESDEARQPHNPKDERGGGGTGGGPGTDAQALWKKYDDAREAGTVTEPKHHMARPLKSDITPG